MFHIVNKNDAIVMIYFIFLFYCINKNCESGCIVIKSVSLNAANKNVAKYTISFLTLGYILHSSIPLTSKMDESFHSLDKELSIVNSELYKPQCKDSCDYIIEKIKEEIKSKKIKTENTSLDRDQIHKIIRKIQIESEDDPLSDEQISEVIRELQIASQNANSKKALSSAKIQTQISRNNIKQRSEGIVLTGYATAYTANANARMANGQKPIEGVHCAMNKKYKGRRVKVTIGNDVRYYDVDDTGPLKNGVIIDIYMNDRQRCINFGKRRVKVEFVPR